MNKPGASLRNKKWKLKYQLLFFIICDIIVWSVLSFFLLSVAYSVIGDATLDKKFQSPGFVVFFIILNIILLVLVTLPFNYLLLKKIDAPIQLITGGLKQVTAGDYSVHLDFPSNNEFMEICKAFNYMTEQLEVAEDIKKNAEKERTLLFANMAHDLKTPITTIIGFSNAITGGMVTDSARQREYLETIVVKACHMNSLVDRLFEYVKLENPDNILHKEDEDLSELLRECAGAIFPEFEDRHMDIDVDIPSEKVVRSVDRLEITRVFTNLLDNILKHNPEGTKVLVRLDSNACVVIADTGTIIAPNVIGHLFMPFVSGDDSRMTRNGSGLGLAIAYKIMKKHGGSLSFESPYAGYTKAFILKFTD